MTIFVAADHAGFKLKEAIKAALIAQGHTVTDCGATTLVEGDDYPQYMKRAAEAVAADKDSFGIIFGGSGQGEAMVANRHEGVRAAEYYGSSIDIVKLAREHNDANVLSIGARFVKEEEALAAVKVFLDTPFSGEARHERRIQEIG